MSTPTDGDQPWQQPEAPQPGSGSGYGRPGSASYGKYGQGQAPSAPPAAPAVPPGAPTIPLAGPPSTQTPQWPGVPLRLKPTSPGLLTAVIVLSVLLSISTIVAGYLAPSQHQALKNYFDAVQNAGQYDDAPRLVMAKGSTLYRLLSPILVLVEVAVWVVSSLWLTRARENALVLWPNGQARSETWVWLGWIIPIVNFWFPRQILRDTVAATSYAAQVPKPPVNLWWACWLGSGLASVLLVGSGFVVPNNTRHALLAALLVVVNLTGLTLWLRLVRWISATQDALFRNELPTTLDR